MRTRKNLNPTRRYSYDAMVLERDAAMKRLAKHPERIGQEGLQVVEREYDRCRLAYARFIPPLHHGTRAENLAHARAARRVVAADLFYATVERDAYRLVLDQIEPRGTVQCPTPRVAKGTRSPQLTKKLSTYRYRLKSLKAALLQVEFQLAIAIEERTKLRQFVDQHAANTYILQERHTAQQAERRLLHGPNARASRSICRQVQESRTQWREDYTRWQGFDRMVKNLRADKARKTAAVENYTQKIVEIIG